MRCFILVFSVLFLTEIAFAFPPADEYQPGKALVYFTEELCAPEISIIIGIPQLGIPTLDKLAAEFSIYRIEKVFPCTEKPDNPLLVDLSRWYRFHFPSEVSVEDVILAYWGQPFIEIIEPDPIRKVDYSPNDPLFQNQWHLFTTKADSAWDINHGSYLVDIAIVDSGVDTGHVDLNSDFWINYGEDANGDSVITLWDWNYIDDDTNGYIDDFWGWDFIDGDNIMHDESGIGHGTSCAGAASAATDNATGVSGEGFDTRLMILRVGDGYIIYNGYMGIQYAGNNGAEVISISWGGITPSWIEQMAITYAWQNGSVICATAGNSSIWTPPFNHYPSKYDHVIAVGASDYNDQIASFSNYCITPFDGNCDVLAPGVDIFSTSFGGGYQSFSGTSMAAPIAAGVCALIRSIDPALTAAEVETLLCYTCDDIYAQNPGYQYGLLGYGRVNAFNAALVLEPYLTLSGVEIEDDGNNDGRPDPGENCELTVSIINDPRAQWAQNLTGVLTCEDEAVVLITTTVAFDDIPPGGAASNAAPFEFYVNPTEPHFADFNLTITTGSGLAFEMPLLIELGRPPILLVDDDEGNDEYFYLVTFEALELFVDVWNQSEIGITAEELLRYDAVIWETGYAQSTLNDDERDQLAEFLDAGEKNLFFSSTNAGPDIGATTFYSEYLHASFEADSVGAFFLDGVENNPISGGTILFLIGGSGSGNNQSLEGIIPVGGAESTYTYQGTPYIGGINFEDWYKMIYFAFPFEAASGIASTSREEIMANILDWFELSQSPLSLTLEPVAPPIQIPAGGGQFQYNIEIANNDTVMWNFDAWTGVILPNGNYFGPLILRNLNLAPGGVITRTITQGVPAGAPSGTYSYNAYLCLYPDSIEISDSFPFEKLAVGELTTSYSEWNVCGWDNEGEPSAVSTPDYALLSVHPNPFNNSTTITLEIPSAGQVEVTVYNLLGEEVITLNCGVLSAGRHIFNFEGAVLSSGMYLLRVNTPEGYLNQKLILIK